MKNYHHRKVVYSWLQGARIPVLLLSAVTYLVWHQELISIILFIISPLLPWCAVVIANGVGEPKDKRQQQIYKPAAARAARAHEALAIAERSPESSPRTELPSTQPPSE